MTPPSGAASDPFTDPPRHGRSSNSLSGSKPFHLRQDEPHRSQTISDSLSSADLRPLTQGERIKAMVRCINNLRYLGVESDVPLPKICVVGDQSAGKSSLVETLSGIKVPRAEGCCTRCPLEVNLIGKDGPWECRLFLVKEYDYIADPKTSLKACRKRPMGPWSPRAQAQVQCFGATENREEVHDLVHRAQIAILNPTADLTGYVPGAGPRDDTVSKSLEVKFSPNIIRLDIEGPEYCNLSFTDLPGIITISELKSERFLVDLVANLMKEHIKRRSCIVILTLPMNTDVENSTAFAMIRDHSAEERTLGVLTKPDRVQSQTPLIRWQEMLLDNSSFRLGQGFHAVMMHPDVALSREAVLDQEKAFFNREEWQLMMSTTPEKVGIPSLTLRLERLLATKIAEELPNISGKVNGRFEAIQQELRKYPARPSVDRYQFELGQLISNLGFGLGSLLEGHGRSVEASPLKQKWHLLTQAFKNALKSSRPSFDISSAAERKLMKKLRASSKASTPSQATKSENTPALMEISSDDETPVFADFKKAIRSFTLEAVGECNERRNCTHIPGQIAQRAIEDLNRTSVSHWKRVALEFVGHVGRLVKEEVKALAGSVFSDYQNTDMYTVALDAIEDFLEKALQDQKEEVVKTCRMEHEHPLTLDDEGMAREEEKAMYSFRKARLEYRVKLAQAKLDSEVSIKGRAKVADEKDGAPEQDHFALHIQIMAVSRIFLKKITRCLLQQCELLDTNDFAVCQSLLSNCCFALCGQHLSRHSVSSFSQMRPRTGRCNHTPSRNRRRHRYCCPCRCCFLRADQI
jgi:GTPase SAR1 family protein